ncbi:MAG TPA: DUF4124 domain-containing protein [Kangiella sp.]|uniref:DUF4124 domain-containing protein n=1 Tax=Kangiella sp. TaxID=1920245 RepID=UPI002F922615
MVNIKLIILIAIFGLGIATIASAAQPIYKWKDDKGNIKYTQTKPPHGISYETINQRVSDSKPATERGNEQSQESSNITNAQDDIIAKQEAQKKNIEEQNKEIAKKNCTIAKNNMEVLENRTRVQIEENGERRMLTDTEREERLKQARENVKKYCEK